MAENTNKINICNRALMLLGVTNFVTSLARGTVEASVFAYVYDTALKSMLQSFPWSFATKHYTLTDISAKGEVPQAFTYAYELPDDCLAVRRVYSKSAAALSFCPNAPFPFTMGLLYETTEAVNVEAIFCNLASALCEGTYYLEDISAMSPLFLDALVWRIALEMSVPLSGGNFSNRQNLTQYYADALRSARTHDANENLGIKPIWGDEYLMMRK